MSEDIRRGDFTYGNGILRAGPGQMARIGGPELRGMFLPKMSTEATKTMNKNPDFVRSQLAHYGVQFEEKEFVGKGTSLLKKALQAGKCDQVPQSILDLEEEMYQEWLQTCNPRRLQSRPEWVLDRYFLQAGQPQPTKTTTVVEILFSNRPSGALIEAAGKVAGLFSRRILGFATETLFLGWDSAAVEKAATEHAAQKRKEIQERDEDRRVEEEIHRGLRRQLHLDYVDQKSKGQANAPEQTPVGSYNVDCRSIEEGWSDMGNLGMEIRNSDSPGVFIADIDFGIVKGIMVICAEQSLLNEYCARLDVHEEDDSDDFDDLEPGYGGKWVFNGEFGSDSDLESESESESIQLDIETDGLAGHDEEESDEETGDEDGDEEEDGEDHPYHAAAHAAAAAASKDLLLAPVSQATSSTEQKPTDIQPGKYFLQLRCYETGEGEVQEPGDGTITFQNGTFDSFVGDADLPFVSGEGCGTFYAYKTSDVPN